MSRISDTIDPMSVRTEQATRGRPREFDADEVLDRVVELFWEQGYEATSVTDIVEATGLNKSSLYNAFGSKETLFNLALERYMAMRIGLVTAALANGQKGLDDLETLFGAMEQELESEAGARGCLAVNASTELGYRDEKAQDVSKRYRDAIREAFASVFERAARRGEIADGMASTYSEVLLAWMLGIAVVARSGAARGEIAAQFEAGRRLVDSWRIS
jgi:TetR/AcrR family transcriptional repressor of nem operon